MAGLGETTARLKRLRQRAAAGRSASPMSRSVGQGLLHETRAFGDNPGQLRMLSYVPDGATAVVVVLHGCTQTAEGYASGAGWLTLADRFGFAVLAPEQASGNNPNRCFNWFQPGDARRGQGEAASIVAMIGRLVSDHALDADRVFVTGLSAGGAMAAALLAGHPEVFAGGGIVAGLPFGAAGSMPEAFDAMGRGRSQPASAWGDEVRGASAHKGPWPTVSIWHGDADRTVSPANADAIVGQWLDVHGLSGAPDQATASASWVRHAWTDRSGRVVVELNRFPALGHGTPLATSGPEGAGEAGAFLFEVGVSSSFEMARSWGLTGTERPRFATPQAATVAAKPRERAPRVDAVFSAPEPPSNTVADVINRALAAAGLLK